MSFPLVGNLSFKKDAGQAGMTDFWENLYYALFYKSSCIALSGKILPPEINNFFR